MTFRKNILFLIIKINRYVLKRKFIPIMAGPLKGYLWNTSYNYDYLTADYESEDTLEIFYSWLKPETVFYDLGGNVGYFAFLANRYITNGIIYSFEPIPFNIAVFKKHLELNDKRIKYHNIEVLPFALSDKDGEVAISHDHVAIEGNTYITSAYLTATETIKVKCYSVDGLLKEGYKKPDVIKIDVEGAEYDVLLGAVKTLKEFKPNILLATHDCHLPGVQQSCKDLLQGLGYRLIQLPGHNKHVKGLNDYIAIHEHNLVKHDRA